MPQDYLEVIDTIDHINIQPACKVNDGDIVVFDCIAGAENAQLRRGISYVLRIDKFTLFSQVDNVCALLSQVDRLNVVQTDVETFSDEDFVVYKKVLNKLAVAVETACLNSKNIQCNLLTDRMMLDQMNNCGAGDTTITLAPDGKFYICPAFYQENQEDALGNLKHSIGDLDNGLDIKNSQLYKLEHAPLCRHCDAYQCKRCVWLNRKLTYEVNTPSHEQCVMAHLERNASRNLLLSIRKHGEFLPGYDIKEINYLDPFDERKEWA